MYFTSKMTDQEFFDFVFIHPVAGACGTHGAEKAAANDQSAFTKSMLSQASTVFGADNGVFNTMKNAYSQLLAAGPSQQGFSAAQQSAMNAAAITRGALDTRTIAGAVGNRQAAFGGGNIPVGASGTGVAETAGVREAVAARTSSELNQIQQENYAQGNKNWQIAGAGLREAPGVFSNLSGVDAAAQTGLDKNMANAQAADAASNWWVKPVTGLVAGGVNMLAPGVGTAMATGGAGAKSGSGSPGGFGNLDTTGGSTNMEQIENFMGLKS